jgi:hypothetical protein
VAQVLLVYMPEHKRTRGLEDAWKCICVSNSVPVPVSISCPFAQR